ncbi:hypothetical protein BDN72DRAFT_949527 [Pluteus cervinus]|uniref:Uncharacterized protein n=1 Tax=Pluteus cervinus TaxID=181527 RepID=A0ACD2ZZK6_9AGAR|nr:hypothetical protein BDN72DRAFT_949527 [Pluteus cervinus]
MRSSTGCRNEGIQNPPQTPRLRKIAGRSGLNGLRRPRYSTVEETRKAVTKLLELDFTMDDWQAQMIHRVEQGYDSILIAGTGYGKSLVFQGLAALNKKKALLVIAPLKALERDQV